MYADNAELSGKYGDLYDLVREGKWTLDVMYEMMKAVAEPDETGAWSENATYGMAGSINIGNVFMNAGGYLPAERTSDGGIAIALGKDANLAAFDRVYNLFSDSTTTMLVERYPQNGWDIVNTAFQEGHALFYSTNASSISIFKNAEDEVVSFGVLPNPKFSESQDRYYHTVNSGNSSVLAVASTNVENVEATCYLLELLGYYGKHTPFKSINDAYYETTLKPGGGERRRRRDARHRFRQPHLRHLHDDAVGLLAYARPDLRAGADGGQQHHRFAAGIQTAGNRNGYPKTH